MPDDYRSILLEQQIGELMGLLRGMTRVQIEGSDGYIFNAIGSSLGFRKADSGSRLPFDLIPSSDTQGNPAITIWPGLVNGILAGNILDTFSVDKGSLWYAKAGCTTDGTQVTSITMYVDTSPPDIQTPATDAMPGEVDVLVGLYKDGMTYNVRGGNAIITPSNVSDAAGHYSGVWA